MNFKIVFPKEDITFSQTEIHAFSFTTDIFKLYSICEVMIKDIASQTINIVKTGMDVDVIFYSEDGNTYKNLMKVCSYTKVPGKQNSLTDYLKLVLLPSFSFVSSVFTKAHQGTVYDIISDISRKYFYKYYTTDFSMTEDVARVRYQVAERSQDFMLKMLKYGIIGNLPVYLYMDARNYLNLKGISEFIKKEPFHVLEPSLVETVGNEPASDRSLNKVNLLDYRFVGDVTGASSKLTTKFTSLAFVSSRDLADRVTLNSTENKNSQSDTVTPESVNFKLWNLTPDDALTISVKENFERSSTVYTVTCLIRGIVFDGFQPGDTIKVILPASPVINSSTGKRGNLGEGVYLIHKVEYLEDKSLPYTRLNLLQVKY